MGKWPIDVVNALLTVGVYNMLSDFWKEDCFSGTAIFIQTERKVVYGHVPVYHIQVGISHKF